jgi:hypothetical protein
MTPPAPHGRRGSVTSAINWMGGLALLLFWLPVAGPFIAGFVGGVKAGTIGRAVAAVFLPAIGIGVMVTVAVAYLADWVWFWGVLAGIGGVALMLLNIGPLLIGALLGGLAARLGLLRP